MAGSSGSAPGGAPSGRSYGLIRAPGPPDPVRPPALFTATESAIQFPAGGLADAAGHMRLWARLGVMATVVVSALALTAPLALAKPGGSRVPDNSTHIGPLQVRV